MTATFWLSLGLGVGLGLLYGAASLWTNRRALTRGRSQFLRIAFVGMFTRMFVALGLIVLILVLLPVNTMAFVGAFFAVFLAFLAYETLSLHRQQRPASD